MRPDHTGSVGFSLRLSYQLSVEVFEGETAG